MPKIVDIPQKRLFIAQSATQLFLEIGYSKLTVSEVAKNAGVAKGSIYKYFDSKEDIVFAIIENEQDSYDKEILSKIQSANTIEEKVLALFDLCIANDDNAIQRRKIYKEFISICIENPSDKMLKFLYNIKQKYTLWLEEIFNDGIKNGDLKPESRDFVDGLFVIGEGVLMFSHMKNYNSPDLLQIHIKKLLKLIKEDKNDI